MVGKVLAEGEASVGVKVGQHFYGREEVVAKVCLLVEFFRIFLCPPVLHVAILIVVASAVVKAVCHLMTYHHSDGSIVERVVSRGVEEWRLQYSGREANLVCRGIVVGVHCLWCHAPLVSVHWLAEGFVEHESLPEA